MWRKRTLKRRPRHRRMILHPPCAQHGPMRPEWASRDGAAFDAATAIARDARSPAPTHSGSTGSGLTLPAPRPFEELVADTCMHAAAARATKRHAVTRMPAMLLAALVSIELMQSLLGRQMPRSRAPFPAAPSRSRRQVQLLHRVAAPERVYATACCVCAAYGPTTASRRKHAGVQLHPSTSVGAA